MEVIIYEPTLEDGVLFFGRKVVNQLEDLQTSADVFVTNRYGDALNNAEKVYTKHLHRRDETG